MKKTLKIITAMFFISVSLVVYTNYGVAQSSDSDMENINTRLDELYGTHDNYHTFFDTLKENIKKRDKRAVAVSVDYPLIVRLKGKDVKIKTEQQFIKNYDAIITPKIEKVVEKQKFDDLFANYQGISFGNGEVYFSRVCHQKNCKAQKKTIIKITGINNFMYHRT